MKRFLVLCCLLPSIYAISKAQLTLSNVVVSKKAVCPVGFATADQKQKGMTIEDGITFLSTRDNLRSLTEQNRHGLLVDFDDACDEFDIVHTAAVQIVPVINVTVGSLAECSLERKINVSKSIQLIAPRSFYIFYGSEKDFPLTRDFVQQHGIKGVFADDGAYQQLQQKLQLAFSRISNSQLAWNNAWNENSSFPAIEARLFEATEPGRSSKALLIVGSVVGSVLGVILVALLVVWLKRRRRDQHNLQLSNKFRYPSQKRPSRKSIYSDEIDAPPLAIISPLKSSAETTLRNSPESLRPKHSTSDGVPNVLSLVNRGLLDQSGKKKIENVNPDTLWNDHFADGSISSQDPHTAGQDWTLKSGVWQQRLEKVEPKIQSMSTERSAPVTIESTSLDVW